eukprot:Skav228320  [mRNA]  locus=scaffold4117:29621:32749:+ [translate_table: standard]
MSGEPVSAVALVTSIGSSRCGIQVAYCSGVLVVPEVWMKHMTIGTTMTIQGFKMFWEQGEVCFDVSVKGATILLHANARRGPLRIAEVFAGISGWSVASRHMGVDTHIMVDLDPIAAAVCGKQHDLPAKSIDTAFNDAMSGNDEACVVIGSVQDPRVWMMFGLCNIAHLTGSPPCQPWSGAGHCTGLSSIDGMVFMDCVKWAARGYIQSFTAENVPGFPKHKDFQILNQEAENAGLSLRLHGVFQANSVIPVMRDRWLGTFLHKDVGVDVQKLTMASNFSFAQDHLHEVCGRPSISMRDVIHLNMSGDERKMLDVPDAAFQAMGDRRFAPNWLLNNCSDQTPQGLVEGRIVDWDGPFQGFMASYGKQHEIDEQLLASRGLHTMICFEDQGLRMISPWEMVATLAFGKQVVLPSNIHDAWRVAGNSLSPVHGFLQLFRTHILLGDKSPFPAGSDSLQIMKQILKDAIMLSHHETRIEGDFWLLVPVNDVEGGESNKKRKMEDEIAPTIPFEVDEHCEIGLRGMNELPIFFRVDDPRFSDEISQPGEGGLALLLHGTNQWAMFVSFGANTTVQEVICKGLPHAKAEHFSVFSLNDVQAYWKDLVPVGDFQKLRFHAVPTFIKCGEKSLGITLNLRCDVTWTVRTACALIATQVGCVPEAIGLLRNDRLLDDSDFLLGYEWKEAEFRFKASLPGYVSWECKETRMKHEVHDMGLIPSNGQNRWFARHPAQKVVRTASVDGMMTVAKLVAILFPDVHATVAWRAFGGEQPIDVHAPINTVDKIDIQWDSFRPLAVTHLRKLSLGAAIDTTLIQAQVSQGVCRAVRSPFKTKSDEVWMPTGMSIAEVAASYFANSQVCTSILCNHGAVILDPAMLTEQTPGFSVLSFRVCPLVGGAKHDNVKQRVRQLLAAKGVKDDELNQRVSGFFAKVNPEKLNDNMKDNDDSFWDVVKRLATDAKFRLILPVELKAFQKDQRGRASDKTEPASKKHDRKKPKHFVPTSVDAHGVVVDACHFSADGEQLLCWNWLALGLTWQDFVWQRQLRQDRS